MAKRMQYRSAFGVWLTDHDIQNYTPPDEKLGYRILAITMAVAAVVFLLLGLLGVANIMGSWGWYMLTIVCLGTLLALIPMVLKPDQRSLGDISQELHLPLDPERSAGYWQDRAVTDIPLQADSEKAEELREE